MTPTETATILRQFNEWRRGDYEPSEQPAPPDPCEISEAIDAAIAMIERLEAAEKERELWAVIGDGMITPEHLAVGESVPIVENTSRLAAIERERDALRGKVAHMEKRLRLILEEPENTMSNSKAMREMIRQARLALGEKK